MSEDGSNRTEAPSSAMATANQFMFNPPQQFNFSKPTEWEKWITRFERYRDLSGLSQEEESRQVTTLIYCLGEEAEDVLNASNLSEAQRTDYAAVKDHFRSVFVGKRNVIYERAKFNTRAQFPDESVDNFVTALHKLAETCNFGSLKEELIRDRFIIGLHDIKLSESLQLDPDLTLTTALNRARQKEAVQKHQDVITRSSSRPAEICETKSKADAPRRCVRNYRSSLPTEQAVSHPASRPCRPLPDKSSHRPSHPSPQICPKCGYEKRLPVHKCPAKDAKCNKCQKLGHFGKVCKSKRVFSVDSSTELSENEDQLFLGILDEPTNASTINPRTERSPSADPFTITLLLDGKPVQFKVDTGADETVVPPSVLRPGFCLQKTRKKLRSASGTELGIRGKFVCQLESTSRVSVQTIYVVEDLIKPLLGRPAIEDLGILKFVRAIEDAQSDTKATDSDLAAYASRYPSLFHGLGTMPGQHSISLRPDVSPVSIAVPRNVALPLRAKVKQELSRMQRLGVIEEIVEPTDWCSGMVVVPKKDGTVRICVDLTNLNKAVKREKSVLPSVEETLALIGDSKYFSKLDANSGFWQVRLDERSAKLTTFITPFGRFFFKRLPFGICSAPEYFQRIMSQILQGIDGVLCHMDDVLIHAATKEEHDARLECVLKKLQSAGVTLNAKCEFNKTSIKFLGHVIDGKGIHPDPKMLESIKFFPKPQNKDDVRRFLGMVNQVGKFIPHLSDLTQDIRGLLKKNCSFTWTESHQKAFSQIKSALLDLVALKPYDPRLNTVVAADASSYGLGAVLLQEDSTQRYRPVAFISKSLNDTESRYAQIEKEAYAITWACERFAKFLIGKDFHIQTDHKPLVPLLSTKDLDKIPARIQRFKMRLMKFRYTISHVPGKELITADALSRCPMSISADSPFEDNWESEMEAFVAAILANIPASDAKLAEIREKQESDPECRSLKDLIRNGWPERKAQIPRIATPYWAERATLTIHDNLIVKDCRRLVIPRSMRRSMLERIHEGHLGIVRCQSRARESVWWPGINKDVENFVQACTECLSLRRPTIRPMISSDLPDYPWQKVGIDIFDYKSQKYLVVIDYYSRFIEMARLSSLSAESIINHLKSIFARHGIPEIVRSDSAPQFESETWRRFARDYGFTSHTSSPLHHQSNGEAERGVDIVKKALQKSKDPYLALLSYRTTPGPSGYSPAELLMGRRLRTTLPSVSLKPETPDHEAFKAHDRKAKTQQKRHFDQRHRVKEVADFKPGQAVFITDLQKKGVIREQLPEVPRSYLVEVGTTGGVYRRNAQFLHPQREDSG